MISLFQLLQHQYFSLFLAYNLEREEYRKLLTISIVIEIVGRAITLQSNPEKKIR